MKKPDQLARFLGYVLGLRPDEFGLAPDPEGFVSIKDLLAALSEDPEWRFIRRAQIKEAIYGVEDPPIVVEEEKIRARMPPAAPVPEPDPPKLLFVAIRERAYPPAVDEGYRPSAGPVVLSCDRELALRMGRRKGKEILLTVNTAQAQKAGMSFTRLGELLFFCESLARGCFTGPALPKPRPEKEKKKKEEAPDSFPAYGSFFINPADAFREKPDTKPAGGRKKRTWKEERRRGRHGRDE